MVLVTGCEAWPAQKAAWERFGNLIGAARIDYVDRGNGETYTVTLMSGEQFKLTADGNQYDGGYANIRFPDEGNF